MSWRRRRTPFAAALALLTAALAGCGDLGSGELARRVDGPAPLTKAQVERYPEGSPARAFFEWWRALQFDDAALARRYYSRRLDVSTKKLDEQLGLGIETLGLGRRPRLVEVKQEGDRATVLVILWNAIRNPNGRTDVTRTGRGFNLVREGGEWKLADNMYLDRTARLIRAYVREARQQQQQPPGQ